MILNATYQYNLLHFLLIYSHYSNMIGLNIVLSSAFRDLMSRTSLLHLIL